MGGYRIHTLVDDWVALRYSRPVRLGTYEVRRLGRLRPGQEPDLGNLPR